MHSNDNNMMMMCIWLLLFSFWILFGFSITTSKTNNNNIHLASQLDISVLDQCNEECPLRMNLLAQVDLACNGSCRIESCQNGCNHFHKSPYSCQQACQQNDYCAVGCYHAHTVYVDVLRHYMKTNDLLQSPSILANSISNDSIIIEWYSLPEPLINNWTSQIQWKYHHIPSSPWTVVKQEMVQITKEEQDSYNQKKKKIARVYGLHAYTAYQFRIQWTFKSWSHVTFYTESSTPITTLAYGPPSTGCIILNLISISPNQISVNWRQPTFPNGPVIAYSLYLVNDHTGSKIVKDFHQQNHHYSERTDTIHHNYVFNDLECCTNYTLSIVTHNNFGEGPRSTKKISTLIDETLIEDMDNVEWPDNMKLYLASSTSVARRNMEMLMDEEILFHLTDYAHDAYITGMAIHVAKRYLFVADSSGAIRRIVVKEHSMNQIRRIVTGSNHPSQLSIDWLNEHLYWIEDNTKLMRCTLDGENQHSIYVSSLVKPIKMSVDPYNGYLFWLQSTTTATTLGSTRNQNSQSTALYRLDLIHVDSSMKRGTTDLRSKVQMIYQSEAYISTFAINLVNYRLLFPMSSTSTIHSITIDGNDEMNIREHGYISWSNELDNMAIYQQRLYFTHGPNITWEEYHPEQAMYYHNTFNTDWKFVGLAIMDAHVQPTPLPLTPVENVEAVFLDTTAKITWQKPALFGASGQGAWQQWKYQISIQEYGQPEVSIQAQVNVTQCDVAELHPDTKYEISVRAFSSAGYGTWSDKFVGRTLPSLSDLKASNNNPRPYALVATSKMNNIFLLTELDGRFKKQLCLLKDKMSVQIKGIDSHGKFIVANSDQQIWIYNGSNWRILLNNSNVESLAIERMALKLYWSVPTERMICRCNVDGSQMEILPIISYAKQIVIDSNNGFLYWSTGTSVRVSYLNGMKSSQRTLINHDHFHHHHNNNDDHQIIKSLTIDPHADRLYWLTFSEFKDYDNDQHSSQPNSGLILNQIELFNSLEQIDNFHPEGLKMPSYHLSFPSLNLIGPIGSFAGRFWWFNPDQGRMMISEDSGTTFVTVSTLNDISAFKLIIEDIKQSISVLPDSVDINSIKVVGSWQNFSLIWKPVTNVDPSIHILYELSIEHEDNSHNHFILNETKFDWNQHFEKCPKPYSPIKMAIRSFTYWASATQTMLTIRTPSSVPSKPRSVRVYTYLMSNNDQLNKIDPSPHQQASKNFVAEARWIEPEYPNGQIQGYTISLWRTGEQGQKVISIDTKVISNQLNYKLQDLKSNATYFLEVRAATDVGEGPPSDVVQFKTFQSSPPMKLLLSESETIVETDIDLLESKTLLKSLWPSSMDYLMIDKILYFVQDGHFLKRSDALLQAGNANYSQRQNQLTSMASNMVVAHFQDVITSLSMDWIGRRLYLATTDPTNQNKSAIWCYREEIPHPELVLHLSKGNYVNKLVADPFGSSLLWTVQRQQQETEIPVVSTPIHRCKLTVNGTKCLKTDIVGHWTSYGGQNRCDCTINRWGTFLLHNRLLIYLDKRMRTFVQCKIDACQSQKISEVVQTSHPPTNIQLDPNTSKLYWINDTRSNLLYATQLFTQEILESKTEVIHLTKPIYNMVRLAAQPYPSHQECLIPPSYLGLKLHLVSRTSNSLTIRIELYHRPQIKYESTCEEFSVSTIRYRIRYLSSTNNSTSIIEQSDANQKLIETYEEIIKINDLKSHTNYSFSVEMDNYYLQLIRNQTRKLTEKTQNTNLSLWNYYENSGVESQEPILMPPFLLKDDHHLKYLYVDGFTFSTAISSPKPPNNVRAIPESPEMILVLWDPKVNTSIDENKVQYEVRWQWLNNVNSMIVNHLDIPLRNGSHWIELKQLDPGTEYQIVVRAYSLDGSTKTDLYADSNVINVKTYPKPDDLLVMHRSPRQIDLAWPVPASPATIVESTEIWYRPELIEEPQGQLNEWIKLSNKYTKANTEVYQYQIGKLIPYQWYSIKMVVTYRPSRVQYEWPKKPKEFKVRTEMTVPDGPEVIQMEQLPGNVYKLFWKSVRSNSPWPVYYQVYVHYKSRSEWISKRKPIKWNLLYNGSDTYRVMTDIQTDGHYYFRLCASNRIGPNDRECPETLADLVFTSDGNDSGGLSYPVRGDKSSNQKEITTILLAAMIIVALFAAGFIIYSYVSVRVYKHSKQVPNSENANNTQMELIPWNKSPHPHLSNTIYANTIPDLSDIQLFDCSTFTLQKLLGKGAFGEVHEAILHKNDNKVAVKLLNTAEDGHNFLKEAKLMSKFKHEHILKLLGVCLNHPSSSIVIVMELMEGGDLLKYLRSNRPQGNIIPLSVVDLVNICIDVAKGCKYLEEQQFVHRDLAARNCLVSSTDPLKRVVKIADFGLSRGLYQQNYYRKEGGLMPVRWMSPESLSDGVFTTKSDVWSFSVIMYEVITLGQQPYQAFSNKEVLEYVKAGGILERPKQCPEQMYNLMKHCWIFEKDSRPDFGTILQQLNLIRDNVLMVTRNIESTTGHIPDYSAASTLFTSLNSDYSNNTNTNLNIATLSRMMTISPALVLQPDATYMNATQNLR